MYGRDPMSIGTPEGSTSQIGSGLNPKPETLHPTPEGLPLSSGRPAYDYTGRGLGSEVVAGLNHEVVLSMQVARSRDQFLDRA